MASKRTSMASMEASTKIIVDGIETTLEEYRKIIRDKKNKGKTKTAKRKRKKTKTELSELSNEIETLIRQMSVLKSFAAYYDNAYRQWGTIANDILECKLIKAPFVKYRVCIREIDGLLDEVKAMAKRNERATFQYIEKISWKLQDIKKHITSIMSGARESGYLEAYKNHEAINGKGRRLGLQTLVSKAFKTVGQIEDTITRVNQIVDDGVDPFKYAEHLSFNARRRLSLS